MVNFIRIAHRGGGAGLHENKIETIKKTLKNKAVDAIEVDVRKTKDNVVVLSHHRGLKINGQTVWIDNVNFTSIKHLGVTTLEEILPLFKQSDKILDIDIKEKTAASEVARVLKKHRFISQVYFSSVDLSALFDIQEEFPNGQYFLSSSIKDSRDFFHRRIIRILLVLTAILLSRLAVFILKKRVKKIKIDGISLFYRFATKEFIHDLKTFGFKVFVWGSDKERDVQKALTLQADGVKTKDVSLFQKLSG